MRRLLPAPEGAVDLRSAYAYPSGTWVRANMVASADGTAVVDGGSDALSAAADKRVFAVLRGLCDAVLVGAGTARSEGYRGLSAKPAYAEQRAHLGQRPAPVLALVSSRLDLDLSSELFTGAERTIVVTTSASDEAGRARLAEVGEVADVVLAGNADLDVSAAIHALAERGLPRILCEGGPSLLAIVAATGGLDELCLTTSAQLIGGSGPRILNGSALPAPARLELAHLLEEDGDLFARYVVRRG